MRQMKKLKDTFIRFFTSPFVSALSTALGIAGSLGVFAVLGLIRENVRPALTIECPQEIRSFQHVVFGRFSPATRRVRVFVHPEDGQTKYWLQLPISESPSPGMWVQQARFGNPFGRGHVKEPPLYYDVFALLLPETKLLNLPGSDEKPILAVSPDAFEERLREASAERVVSCRILRRPETCNYQPTVLKPLQPDDPKEYANVRSPVLIEWRPNIPMYVELWHDAEPVEGKSHLIMNNRQSLVLSPGLYELKARQFKESECEAGVWFIVAQD